MSEVLFSLLSLHKIKGMYNKAADVGRLRRLRGVWRVEASRCLLKGNPFSFRFLFFLLLHIFTLPPPNWLSPPFCSFNDTLCVTVTQVGFILLSEGAEAGYCAVTDSPLVSEWHASNPPLDWGGRRPVGMTCAVGGVVTVTCFLGGGGGSVFLLCMRVTGSALDLCPRLRPESRTPFQRLHSPSCRRRSAVSNPVNLFFSPPTPHRGDLVVI